MKVEMETPDSRTKGAVVREAWFYGPTSLEVEDPPCHTLFVRRFRHVRMPSGREVIKAMKDVEQFPSMDALLTAIEERGMEEWAEIDNAPPVTTLPISLWS